MLAVIDQNSGRFLTLGSDHGKDTPDERCGNRPARAREKAHAEPDADQLEVDGRRHGGFSQYDENRSAVFGMLVKRRRLRQRLAPPGDRHFIRIRAHVENPEVIAPMTETPRGERSHAVGAHVAEGYDPTSISFCVT